MKKLKKIVAVVVLFFALLSPLCVQQCDARSHTHAGHTQNRHARHIKRNMAHKRIHGKKTLRHVKGKHTRSRRKHKRRHRRGAAMQISSHETSEQKKRIARIAENLEKNPDCSGDNPNLDEASLVWPLKYGYIARGVRGRHRGLDIMSRAGEPVYAIADGVVEFVSIGSKAYRGYGKLAIIRHEDKNLWSLYSHCSAIYLHEGQHVRRGQKIAAVGRTGLTTSNHLHFEMRGAGKKLLNPLTCLPQEGKLGHSYVPH